MHIGTCEQETIISFGRTDEKATVYSTDKTLITRLDKIVSKNPTEIKVDEVQEENGKVIAKTYKMPKKFISFRSKSVERHYTEAQREVLRNNAKRLHE